MQIHFNKIKEVQISNIFSVLSLVRSQLIHKGSPVFIPHLDHGAVKAVVLTLDLHGFRGLLELLAEGAIIKQC